MASSRARAHHARSRASGTAEERPGVPVGDRALEEPPHHTFGPNPTAAAFAKSPERPGRRSPAPFATDVRGTRHGAAYQAHGYHTKVPAAAIVRYLLHYTRPGDLVYDGFCGSGMTGVAALACAAPDDQLREAVEREWRAAGRAAPAWGARRAFLCDLSPAATFIAASFARAVADPDPDASERAAEALADEVEAELGALFETDAGGGRRGRVVYTLFSDLLGCARCGGAIPVWRALDRRAGRLREHIRCPACGARGSRRALERLFSDAPDPRTGRPAHLARSTPVRIVYELDGRRHEKAPDAADHARLARARELVLALPPDAHPVARVPDGDKTGDLRAVGIEHVHQLYTDRNLLAVAALWMRARRRGLGWLVTAILPRASKQHQAALSRFGARSGEGGKTAGHRRGTLYVPAIQVEFNPLALFRERARAARKLAAPGASRDHVRVETCSAARSSLPDASVNYAFVDPPFGSNLQYAELNFSWEAWLGVFTDATDEAVVNRTRARSLADYGELLERCFQDIHRVLKPGGYVTVVFHNSERAVWNTLSAALSRAGFAVRAVHTLDKGTRTHTQRTAALTVEKDLVISATKRASQEARPPATPKAAPDPQARAWHFVARRLGTLPRTSEERKGVLLYDRLVARKLQRGEPIPLDAAAFYRGLGARFVVRRGLWYRR